MRQALLLMMLIIIIQSFGQSDTIDFQITDYNRDGSEFKKTSIKIPVENYIIDLPFYRKNFMAPDVLPEKFMDPSYKNESFTIWNDVNAAKDFTTNWTKTFVYDSLSRLVSYSYSGCRVCAVAPYTYTVSYDSMGRVVELADRNMRNIVYAIGYDDLGNVVELNCFRSGTLAQRIACYP